MQRNLQRLFSSFAPARRQTVPPWMLVVGASALGALLGAGGVAFFGPGGRRRRALLGDSVRHTAHEAAHGATMVARDLGFRARGVAADVRHAVRNEAPASDTTLLERARSALGHACSHPHGVHIDVRDGVLDVYGPVLASEYGAIISALRHVRGVREVRDHLDVSDSPDHIPSLQGQARRQGPRLGRWSPSARLFAFGTGAALLVWGIVQRASRSAGQRAAATLAAAAGAVLVVRASTNRDTRALLGIGVGPSDLPRRGVQVQKTLHVRAPVQDVFSRFAQLESFPRFMAHVKEVTRLEGAEGQQRFRWRVEGPLGISAAWSAVVTEVEPDRLIAWRSEEGSMVDNVGSMRFEPQADGTTRMTLHLSYEPPAGAVGHAVARLFGRDPKRMLDDDLLRFQSLLETGHATGREGQVSVEEVRSSGTGAVH